MAKKTTDKDEDQTTTGPESDEDDEDQTATGGTSEGDADDEDEDDPEAEEAAILAALPPAAIALFEKTRERLAKANASSSNRRKIIQQMRAAGQAAGGTGGQPPKPKAPTTEGKPATFDPEAFKADLLATFQSQQQTSTVQSKAERALKAAGLNLPEGEAGERKLARVMRMVDWSNVAPDEVADEIDDLKADNPELFTKRAKRPKTGGVGGPGSIKPAKPTNKFDDIFD